MPFKLAVMMDIALPPEADVKSFKLQRAVPRCAKMAHAKMGRYWRENMLAKHFEPGAGKRYGYQQRTPRYRKWKFTVFGTYIWRSRKQFFGGNPLHGGVRTARWRALVVGRADQDNVLTGELRNAMLRQSAGYRAFPTRVTITMPTLPYIFRPNRPGGSKHPDKAKEITGTLAPNEHQVLAGQFASAFWDEFKTSLRKKRLFFQGGRVMASAATAGRP